MVSDDMPKEEDLTRKVSWYQARWRELMDILPSSAPDEVVEHVRNLQIERLDDEDEAIDELQISSKEEPRTVLQRIFDRLKDLRRENQTLHEVRSLLDVDSTSEISTAVEDITNRLSRLEEQQKTLNDAGFEHAEVALEALASMEEQLNDLYGEKEVTEKNDLTTLLEENGDTFDQLQALLAREEKLQRELGVNDPDAVIEMVEGLSAQLEDLYEQSDSTDSIFAASADDGSGSARDVSRRVETELGVSDPDAVTTMVRDLSQQLEALYEERERLAEFDLEGPDDALRMVKNMQQQLEALYEGQEQMSEHGIEGIEYALSVIENMEAQLGELYEDRRSSETAAGPPTLDEVTERLNNLEKRLSEVTEEKELLRENRDRLRAQFIQIQERLGTGDPDAISAMIESLTSQLEDVYRNREASVERSSPSRKPVLDEESKRLLQEMNVEAVDAKSVGVFGLDQAGTIQRANRSALQWPDVDAGTPDALVGENLFDSVAPGANNALFRGRFSQCVESGKMDEQFSYTYVDSEAHATNLYIHVFSAPEQNVHWIAFRVLERH